MREYISDKLKIKDIWYSAGIIIAAFFVVLLTGCSQKKHNEIALWDDMEKTGEITASYAGEFTIDMYGDDFRLITINGESRFLVASEKAVIPEGVPSDITIIRKPVSNIYLASSSDMDYIRKLGCIDKVTMSGIKANDWKLPEAKEAMENGSMIYVGKYNTPDYELILSNDCNLIIENTMIEHNPEVKEKFEGFDIPVLVGRASYELSPLGRMEWIKLYGVLFDKEDEAEKIFDEIEDKMNNLSIVDGDIKTVAFFYVTGNKAINVRKSKDYIAKLIEMAGGRYVFDNLKEEEENALATVNMQQESFYAEAKDTDILIYNSTIVGELNSVDELLKLCPILEDFKAVKEGNVYCTSKNFFQEGLSMGDFAEELNLILNDKYSDDFSYLHKLK